MYDIDRDIWDKSPDPNFLEICHKSLVPMDWTSFEKIDTQFDESILKPINKYVQYLYPPPDLVSISETEIVLRQRTHADIYILNNSNSGFFNIDRPWIRQYYKTNMSFPDIEDCFSQEAYKFYVPWVIDTTTDVTYRAVPGSAIVAHGFRSNFNGIPDGLKAINPPMVPCYFKRVGKHMKDPELGIIKRGEPIFDMVIPSTDIIESRVRSFYANYRVSPIFRQDI
jgi:hypothetical protein